MSVTMMFSGLSPSSISRVRQARAAAPAPAVTRRTLPMSLPTTRRPLRTAAAHHDGGAVLVVVEHRDLHALLERLLDDEALRGLDVLQIDAAEGRLQPGDGLDQCLRVALVDLDVEHVDVGELLEQHRLAFHHRLAGQAADGPKTQHGGAVGDDRDQVGAGGVERSVERVCGDLLAGRGHPRRVGQGEIALIGQGLGRLDLQLPGPGVAVVLERALTQFVWHSLLV